jgi:hypothetical protein
MVNMPVIGEGDPLDVRERSQQPSPKDDGLSLKNNMPNLLRFGNLRDIGLTAPVWRCIPGRPLCRLTRKGCYLPPLLRTGRHTLANHASASPTGRSDCSGNTQTAGPFFISAERLPQRKEKRERYPSVGLKATVSRGILFYDVVDAGIVEVESSWTFGSNDG